MRLLFRLLIVLIICLVAMALPAAPAQANGAYITLSPSSGVPGEKLPSMAIILRLMSGLIFTIIWTLLATLRNRVRSRDR